MPASSQVSLPLPGLPWSHLPSPPHQSRSSQGSCPGISPGLIYCNLVESIWQIIDNLKLDALHNRVDLTRARILQQFWTRGAFTSNQLLVIIGNSYFHGGAQRRKGTQRGKTFGSFSGLTPSFLLPGVQLRRRDNQEQLVVDKENSCWSAMVSAPCVSALDGLWVIWSPAYYWWPGFIGHYKGRDHVQLEQSQKAFGSLLLPHLWPRSVCYLIIGILLAVITITIAYTIPFIIHVVLGIAKSLERSISSLTQIHPALHVAPSCHHTH